VHDFWFFLTSTALFDSLSTAIPILFFVYLLSSKRPLTNSLSFLAGTSLAYLGCGLVFLYNAETINAFFARYFPNETSLPDPLYYGLQGLFGLALVVGTVVVSVRKPRRNRPSWFDRIKGLTGILNPVSAFILGAFLSVTGFPASVPYLGALEKLAAAEGPQRAIAGTLYYNFVYIVPVLVPLVLYLVLHRHDERAAQTLDHHTQKWAPILNRAVTALLGVLFVVDSTVFWMTGQPLLTSKFF